jgi:hypothetical protein
MVDVSLQTISRLPEKFFRLRSGALKLMLRSTEEKAGDVQEDLIEGKLQEHLPMA